MAAKPGYSRNGITLYHGDCFDVLPSLEEGSIDLVLCDPPYGITACKWDKAFDFGYMWQEVNRVSKECAAQVFTASQPFTSLLVCSNLTNYKCCWYWAKSRVTGVLNAKRQPLRCVEEILVFYRAQCMYNPQGVVACDKTTPTGDSGKGNSENYGSVKPGTYNQKQTGYPRQLLHIPSVGKTTHPTQKPVPLMEYMIKAYSQPGETVLDFCMGSGTTGVACINTGRKFIGIEKEKKYFDTAVERIKEAEANNG